MSLSGTQDYIMLNDWMAANIDKERVLKEGVVAYFKLLCCYLPEGTRGKNKKFQSGNSVSQPRFKIFFTSRIQGKRVT
jgi:hypothetical protein